MMRFISTILLFLIACLGPSFAGLTNRYVVKNNAGAAAPYDSLANAAGDIQTAINYSYAGETVLVAAATYDSGGTNIAGQFLTNRVYISKAITLRSLDNDPANTVIKGARDPVSTNGSAAVRCVYMVGGAALAGFTLSNGATATSGDYRSMCGGGVYCASATAAISNCVIAGNAGYGDSANGVGGGGACFGAYFNCRLTGNQVGPGRNLGGAAHDVILSNCVIAGNAAPYAGGNGGGVHRGALYYCLVSNNYANYGGGGVAGWSAAYPVQVYHSTLINNTAGDRGGAAYNYVFLYDCDVSSNTAVNFGGGVMGWSQNTDVMINCRVSSNYAFNGGAVYAATLTNCVIAYNRASYAAANNCKMFNTLICGNHGRRGGAVYGNAAGLYNCTVVGNNAELYCGGILRDGAGGIPVINCIVYSNSAPSHPNWWTNVSGAVIGFSNSCTWPAAVGWDAANTTNNPLLTDFGKEYGTNHVSGNYRLTVNSPCVNSGTNQAWMSNAFDLDGHKRLHYGQVDMGAYEAIYNGTVYSAR